MFATFINSFVLFFITIDAIGNLPFFLSLTEATIKIKIEKISSIRRRHEVISSLYPKNLI